MRRLGPYLLAARLSRGESGEVFLSWRDDGPGFAALELFDRRWSDDLGFSRDLFHEASDAPALRHPRLVPIWEVGRSGGHAFLAQEFVGGQPWFAVIKKARLEDEPVSVGQVLGVFLEVLQGLAAAHQAEPRPHVHGRLGPKNVVITYGGQVRLLGFGSGRARQRLPMSAGRVPHVAPEVLNGRPAGPASDIFSACALLYEALSGRPAFRRADAAATRRALQQGDLAPLRPRQLGVPPEVVDWLQAVLVPRPEARPAGGAGAGIELVRTALAELGEPSEQADLSARMDRLFAEEAEGLRKMMEAARPATAPRVGADPVSSSPSVPQTSDLLLDAVDGPRRNANPRGPDGGLDEAGRQAAESQVREADYHAAWEQDTLRNTDFGEDDGTLDPVRAGTPDLDRSLEGQPVSLQRAGAASELKQIARYRLGAVLSTEGPVQVRLAVDPNLGRRILVKVYDPDVADARVDAETRVRLFKREARYATRIVSRRFPTLLDAGRGGGCYFIVYERRPGLTLPEHLAEGRPLDLVRVLDGLAEGLSALHEAGLLYGRIEPAQVRIRDGEAEFASWSTVVPHHRVPHPLWSADDPWAPPEFRQSGRWTEVSDQHQLGMFARRLAAGLHRPAGSQAEPPDVNELDLEPGLAAAIRRMIEEDPRARFESLAALRAGLRELPGTEEGLRAGGPAGGPDDTDRLAVARAYACLARAAVGVAVRDEADGLRFLTDPAWVVAAVARRLGWGVDEIEMLVMAAAAKGLAERTRLPTHGEAFQALVPPPVGVLLAQLEPKTDAVPAESEGSERRRAELLRLVEAFTRAASADRIHRNPHRYLEPLAARFPITLVDALKSYLTDLTQRAEPRAGGQPRAQVLLAGARTHVLVPAMDDAGLDVLAVDDGHAAWEAVRESPIDGLVLASHLPGRDGLSVMRLCRNHPDLESLPVWMLDTGLSASERRLASELGAVVVADASGADMLRDLVLYRLVPRRAAAP